MSWRVLRRACSTDRRAPFYSLVSLFPQALAPIYESLATKLKAREGWGNVVLAKLDATANDYALDGVKVGPTRARGCARSPPCGFELTRHCASNFRRCQVEGFPTVYLFPASSGAAPILYTSARDEASFIDFLSANAKSIPVGDADEL